jgi:hypothetical protein
MPVLATLAAVLTITVWPQGTDGPSRTHLLRCPGGADCARLARVEGPFAPVPVGIACTMIYGGPQVAVVTGTYAGRRVWARFRRTDGCQVHRWDRVSFLFD